MKIKFLTDFVPCLARKDEVREIDDYVARSLIERDVAEEIPAKKPKPKTKKPTGEEPKAKPVKKTRPDKRSEKAFKITKNVKDEKE